MLKPICLLLLVSVAAAQDKPPEKATISGAVVNSITGEPLSKVEITAEGSGESSHLPFATTDPRGNFTLSNLLPGQYRLKGRRNGFLETEYGARRAESGGVPITLEAAQNLRGLQFKLVPYGVIAGTIRDQDGEALDRVSVHAYRMMYGPGGRRSWSEMDSDTNDLGQYRISGLEPGRYYIRAEPPQTDAVRAQAAPSLEIMIPSLYPGVQDPGAARAIELEAGARVTGIDLALPRRNTVRVSGHATVAAGAKLGYVAVNYAGSDTELGFNMHARLNANGEFDFPAVPAGAWTLTASASPPQKPTNNLYDLMVYQSEYKTRVPLQVSNLPLANVQVTVGAGVEIAGHITTEAAGDGRNSDPVRGEIRFESGSDGGTAALIQENATFTTSLLSGHYDIDRQIGQGFIVHAVKSDGKDILDEGLTVSGPGRVPLEVVLAKDGGEISGVVLDKDGKPVAGATVVLIPEARLRAHASLFQHCETDQNGHYQIKTIPPGDYKLFAWEDIEPGIWWDPDFLRNYESSGQAVTVKPKGRDTTELHLAQR